MISQSESIKDLAAALAAAQGAFPSIPKNRTATIKKTAGGEFSYKYADLSDIISATTPSLSKNGLAVSQDATMKEDGNLVLVTTLMHSSGEWKRSVWPLKGFDRPQEQGSEISYMRRYTVCAILNVQGDEDDDGQVAQAGDLKAQKAAKATAANKTAAPKTVSAGELFDPMNEVCQYGQNRQKKFKDIPLYELDKTLNHIIANNVKTESAMHFRRVTDAVFKMAADDVPMGGPQ